MKTEIKFLILLGAFAATPALAQVYRWVDEKGTVHYSNGTPPPLGVLRGSVALENRLYWCSCGQLYSSSAAQLIWPELNLASFLS